MFRRIFSQRVVPVILVLLVVSGLFVVPAGAQEEDDEEEDDGDTIINIELDSVVDAIEDLIDEFQDFTGNWDTVLKDVLTAIIFEPFRELAEALVGFVASILSTTPRVYPNPSVEDVHRDVLVVTYLLSGAVFALTGILYMMGPTLGVSYSQVRHIIPRLITALVLSTVSLPLLQLLVDLTNALSTTFTPTNLHGAFQQLLGLSTGLVLVWVVNAALLLAVVALFILRDVYILFVAAISPLLLLLWSIPNLKRYADTFIGGFVAALLIGPLNLLVLKFSLALMSGAGTTTLQSVSNWVFGVASLVLLLLVPYQVWNASQSAVGQAYAVSREMKTRVHNQRNKSRGERDLENDPRFPHRPRNRRTGRDDSNPFAVDWGDD